MPLTSTEVALESKCERIARMITRRYGVRVRVEGVLAYVDGKAGEIVLPNFTQEQLAQLGEVIDGFLDHECAHLLFTDFALAEDLSEPVRGIWNSIEDAWVERRMGEAFVGCRDNLAALDEAMAEKIAEEWAEIPAGGKLTYLISRCARSARHLDHFLESDLADLANLLAPELLRAERVASTGEAIELAQALAKKIMSAMPPGVTEEKKDLPEMLKVLGPVEREVVEAAMDLLLGEGERYDAEWLVNRTVPPAVDLLASGVDGPRDYLVFSTEFDAAHEFTGRDRFEWSKQYRDLRDTVSDYIGNMAAMLELALADQAQVRWIGGAWRGRKWDRRAMPRWFLGDEHAQPFMRKDQGVALNTAVSLLWDCSASMGCSRYEGSKAGMARLAAVAFHEALLRANVPHEVLAFNTMAPTPGGLIDRVRQARERGEDFARYSRVDEVDNLMVLVPFGGTDGRAICAIDGEEANRDGECVLWAAKRLAQRPEARKVLIVGSDGEPQGAIYQDTERRYLREVVKRIAAAGIDVIGIGIQSSAVKKFYPKWVVLKEIAALPETVMRELVNLLTSEAHRGSARAEGVVEGAD